MKNFLSCPSSFDFELPVPQLKNLLATVIAPELSGFTYNDAYFWYSPWKDHCRKVIQVYPLKGASYIFLWGLCFDFLPVFGEAGGYRYQRTDKSVGLHLFCWPPGHWDSASGQSVSCREILPSSGFLWGAGTFCPLVPELQWSAQCSDWGQTPVHRPRLSM